MLRHGVRRDGIQADRRQHERHDGKDREHGREHAQQPAVLRERLVHRPRSGQRLIGIDPHHRLAQDLGRLRRIAARARQDIRRPRHAVFWRCVMYATASGSRSWLLLR